MAEQETLHNGSPVWKPEEHGTWKRVQFGEDGITLDSAAINRARAEHEFVGTCRECGGHLTVQRGRDHRGETIDWTDLECIDCGKEYAAPNGKLLRRSSRHSLMPAGWWARRMAALKTARSAF